ncbi:thioredoxin family protein [Mesonia sp. K4-1]|uniref:thioredoxin family protein n=1 Tax=Mesonia sp. K4-1 TaxID=2602760 RepID=UPI0011CC27BB|nr:thioredoxin family protein [Mesonia sp. K4-1]TXK78662.1 thioredoxin family protein [Mesonia sp. K4-1]
MKTTYFILLIFIFGLSYPLRAQQNEEIYWLTWEELDLALEENPKPVFIFFHAEWCAYCKKIEREIFTKKKVIGKLNKKYYAVEMDIETEDTIHFDGQKFSNMQSKTKRNGVHQLPLLLASRKNAPFSLPVTLIFDKDFRLQKRVFEYYTSKELLQML